jgi:hypothetical protein
MKFLLSKKLCSSAVKVNSSLHEIQFSFRSIKGLGKMLPARHIACPAAGTVKGVPKLTLRSNETTLGESVI